MMMSSFCSPALKVIGFRAAIVVVMACSLVRADNPKSNPSSSATTASASYTDEVLAVTPRNIAGCLIVEDLDANYRRWISSPTWSRWRESKLCQQILADGTLETVRRMADFLAGYFGLSIETLRTDLLGRSTILAFALGKEGKGDLGIVLFRARDAEVLQNLVASQSERLEKREHRGVSYYRQKGPLGNKSIFLIALGSIGGLSDREEAIRAVIDTSIDGNGLGSVDAVRIGRTMLPKDSVAQLLIYPRALDDRFHAKKNDHRHPLIAMKNRFWQSLHWTALSVTATDRVSIAWHAAFDANAMEPAVSAFLSGPPNAKKFWQGIPLDGYAAGLIAVDFNALADLARKLLDLHPKKDIEVAGMIAANLLPGYDLKTLVDSIGPQVGFLIASGEAGSLNIFAGIELRDQAADGPGGLSLGQSLEMALRPVLAVIPVEANKEKPGSWQTKLEVIRGVRFHYLMSATQAPAWVQPGFMVHGNWLIVASSPVAIHTLLDRYMLSAGPDSPMAKWLDDRFDTTFRPTLWINLAAIRSRIAEDRTSAIELMSEGDKSRTAKAAEDLDHLLSLASLVDHAVAGVRVESAHGFAVRHWSATFFPPATER